jgi:hypothetical protein
LDRGGRLITTGWSKNIWRDEDNYRVEQEHRGDEDNYRVEQEHREG